MMFKSTWSDLETVSAPDEKGMFKRSIGSLDSICPMFLCVKRPQMHKAFILEIPKDISPSPEAIRDSKGFGFTISITGKELNADYVSLILTSAKTEYNEAIESISELLYSKLHLLKDRKEILSAFLSQVRLLQIFFEKQGTEGLSLEAQKGLYGELYFLENYLLNNNALGVKSLRYWTGPISRQHDFQFGNVCVEVKTTSSKQHQKLYISSEQQLDESLIDKLYLFYLSISLVNNHTENLPAIIERIRRKIHSNTEALDLFNNCLLERGYLDLHQGKYEDTGYSVRKFGVFNVVDDFPRLKETDLRKGVGDVTYSISVDACSNYSISEQELIKNVQSANQ